MMAIATPKPVITPPSTIDRKRSRWRKSSGGSIDCQMFIDIDSITIQ